MADTETRESIVEGLGEVVNTLVAASNKIAQLQLDADGDGDGDTTEVLAAAMNDLGPILETIERLADDYQMETNRIRNEE